jgi:hypothetical protein
VPIFIPVECNLVATAHTDMLICTQTLRQFIINCIRHRECICVTKYNVFNAYIRVYVRIYICMYLQVVMSVNIKFHFDLEGGHIDIKLFYMFRKVLIAPASKLRQSKSSYIVVACILNCRT